jgi:hypothetical protein
MEIGPGYGRWSQYLKNYCERLILIDLAPRCIAACQERLGTSGNIEYVVNDGLSFPDIPDRSVNFIFSFDSLVHADPPVFQSYLLHAAKKLTPNGYGFMHHSNLGSYRGELPRERPANEYWRSRTMSAQLFREQCSEAGLSCFRQELVQWLHSERLLDCFSTFRRRGATEVESVVCNTHFMAEAMQARTIRGQS